MLDVQSKSSSEGATCGLLPSSSDSRTVSPAVHTDEFALARRNAVSLTTTQDDAEQRLNVSSCDDPPPTLVAVGAIKIQESRALDSNSLDVWLCIGGPYDGTVFPESEINYLVDHGCVRTEVVQHTNWTRHHSVRITVQLNDVKHDPSSAQDLQCRRYLKRGMAYVDKSRSAWDADWDTASQFESYQSFPEQESLFYLFNTLPSPCPKIDDIMDADNRRAVEDILEDSMAGMRTTLYPYQRRSAAMMVQRETYPKQSLDPRKSFFLGPTGQGFYYDKEEGFLALRPPLLEEARGGILAETMGYGKTLICLAVILATRGHYSQIPTGSETRYKKPKQRVASLAETIANKITENTIPWKIVFHNLAKKGYHYDGCVSMLECRFKEYTERLSANRTPHRHGKPIAEKLVRLSSATLVIVQQNLLCQWQQEIEKHVDGGSLDVLVLDCGKVIPQSDQLALYDVVLVTKTCFDHEYRDSGRELVGGGIYQSPLTNLRWLRVILDEGVGFGGSMTQTSTMAMLDIMYFDRRWVVSGTPSNSLHGVEVGLAANETLGAGSIQRPDIQTALQKRRKSKLTNRENQDLDKLRVLAIKFLKVKPWASMPGSCRANWSKYLVPFDTRGERKDVSGLRTLLEGIMVRHTIESIQVDVSLPPLYNRVVYLEPSFHDKLSINIVIMLLISNSITSEREGQDYMFHASNRKPLEDIIANLRRSTFHWTGSTKASVEECVQNSKEHLENKATVISATNSNLLMSAIEVGERAMRHPGWLALSTLHEMGIFVEDFPDHAVETWSLDQIPSPLLLGTVQAKDAQEYVAEHAQDGDPAEGLPGAGVRALTSARRRAERDTVRDSSRGAVRLQWREENQADRKQRKRKRSSIGPDQSDPQSAGQAAEEEPSAPALPYNSPLNATNVVGFSSSKLSYLIDQILLYHATDKIIIFYDDDNVAFFIGAALDLFSLSYRIYARSLSTAQRVAYLSLFTSKPTVRVLLMDLKEASHGLHIAAATRIYIPTPIWQPHIEAQAIKRAHRIGQTAPVHVETLVLRGTLEDIMLKRRREMSHAELKVAERSLLDDRGADDGRASANANNNSNNKRANPNRRATATIRNLKSDADGVQSRGRGMRWILEEELGFLPFFDHEVDDGPAGGPGQTRAMGEVARLTTPRKLF